MTKKLEKVLEYLINDQEDKAKELLHQVFIEKARSIHEDLINMDEEVELDEIHMGDEGSDFVDDVDHSSEELDELADEIEAEETMSEEEDVELDTMDVDMPDVADDEMGGDDMGDDMMDLGDDDLEVGDDMGEEPDVADLEDKMDSLEDALAELKAEFEKLEAGDAGEEEAGDDFGADEVEDEAGEEEAGDEGSEELDETAVTEEEECDEEEEEMDESWLAEFEDLDEGLTLDKVTVPSGEGEVGSGHYAPVETNTKSPTAKAPAELMGAKPVVSGKGPTHSGYNLEGAPTSGELPNTKDNRRKKSTEATKTVSKEGDASAKLNKTKSEFGAETHKKSPLSSSPRK